MAAAAGETTAGEPRRGRIAPLVVLLAAVSGGIVLDRYQPWSVGIWLSLALAALGSWYPLWHGGARRAGGLALLAGAVAVGAAWHHDRWQLFAQDEVGRWAREESQPICLEALAWTSPRRMPAPPPSPLATAAGGERTQLVVQAVRVRDGAGWRPASGVARLVVDGQLLGIRVGDTLRLAVHISAPAARLNPGEFDRAWARRVRRQLAQVHASFPDSVAVVARGSPWSVRRAVAALRDRCHRLLWQSLGTRQAGLASAVLLGIREDLEEERTQDFFTTGTIHLLSISGLHVGVLAYGFWWLTRLFALRRRMALVTAAAFVVAYTALIETQPPVVRATVLVVTFCLARLCGRRTAGFNLLAAAGLIILAWNPAELFQVGTQLSFLAVATIYYFVPQWRRPNAEDPLDRLIARTRPWPVRLARRGWTGAGQLAALGALIWLVTLPLTMYRFHLVSPIAIVLNPLVSIPMAAALFSGFGVLLFGWLVPPLGQFCGWLCNGSLALLEGIVAVGQQREWGYFWTPGPELWWVLGLYAGLAVLAAQPAWRPPWRWCGTLFLVWTALGVCSSARVRAWFQPADQRPLVCTCIAVGHGTSVLLELPGGETVLYDAGRLGPPEGAVQTIAGVLWSRGVTHLDAVILSHADADHFNALPGLLERFRVGVVYVSPMMFAADRPSLAALHAALQAARIPIREVCAGDRLAVDETTRLEILHPTRRGAIDNDNANSLVLCIERAGRRLLLPGDLSSPGLDDVLAEEPLDCDVVLAPHHGSPTSQPEQFAAWSTPEWMIVSGGRAEERERVERAGPSASRTLLYTARQGAVRVTVTQAGIDVRAWREQPW